MMVKALWNSFLLVVLFVMAQIVAGASAYILSGAGDASNLSLPPDILGGTMVVAYVVLLLMLWVTKIIRRRPLTPQHPVVPKGATSGIFGTLSIAIGLGFLLTPLHLDDGGSLAMFDGVKASPVCILLLTIVGPLTEEVVFREGVQRMLLRGGMRPWAAVLVASAFFALIHGNLAQAFPAFVLGAMLGVLYLRTGDIRLCLPAHILNNVVALVGLYYPVLDEAPDALPLWASLLVGSALVVFGGILLRTLRTPRVLSSSDTFDSFEKTAES